jgi:hypothetical protein
VKKSVGESESARGCAPEPESVRDDMTEFAYVPRHLVPLSIQILKCALERGCRARSGHRLADHERVDLYALRCWGFAELWAGAGVKALSFVVIGNEWRRGDVAARAGGVCW